MRWLGLLLFLSACDPPPLWDNRLAHCLTPPGFASYGCRTPLPTLAGFPTPPPHVP